MVTGGSGYGRSIQSVSVVQTPKANWTLLIDAPALSEGMHPSLHHSIAATIAAGLDGHVERMIAGLADLLDPEFALALWNPGTKRLVLARDAIGARPLFWRRDNEAVLFASSRQDLAVGWPKAGVNEGAIAVMLATGGGSWSRQEYLAGLDRVPHAGFVLITRDKARSGLWWRPAIHRSCISHRQHVDAAQEVRLLLEDAVAARLGATQVVGAHVSGGIDSTGVGALAARRLKASGRAMVGAYAWSPPLTDIFPDMGWRDERQRIAAFTAKEGVPTRFGGVTAADLVAFLERPIEIEGTADLADELPILHLAQSDGVQIMVSGWGGDEAFSSHGFGYLAYLLATLQWDRAVRWIRAQLRTLRRIGPVVSTLWWQGIHPMLPTPLYRLFDPYGNSDMERSLISPDLLKRHRDEIQGAKYAFRVTANPSDTMFRHVMAGHITHRIETWDVWSRHSGFRYTYPLTDRRLLEKLLSLPPEHLFPNETPRGLALAVLHDVLPPGVTKYDAANEASRVATRESAWRILAEKERRGDFSGNCPWLDMRRFRDSLANPKDQRTTTGVVEFLSLFTAVRVWHLWKRTSS